MGTRGAFGFFIDGKTKATYNHYDSYPDGLGEDMAKFVHKAVRGLNSDPVELLTKVRALQPVPTDREPTEEEIERLAPWTNLGVSSKSTSDWYCLLREAQGDPEALLESGFYSDAESFLADSLFCEWAFIVNFDDEVFEVYQGFQKESHSNGRYADMPVNKERGYYPVALLATYPLTGIPEDWVQKVNKLAYPDSDED